LQLLALKIWQDWLKDKERWRIKLAEELIKSADLLKQAWDLLEKWVYS
jgi:hypothetical protein